MKEELTMDYYARNDLEREADNSFAQLFVVNDGLVQGTANNKLLVLFTQNQGIISMLRHIEDRLDDIEKRLNNVDNDGESPKTSHDIKESYTL